MPHSNRRFVSSSAYRSLSFCSVSGPLAVAVGEGVGVSVIVAVGSVVAVGSTVGAGVSVGGSVGGNVGVSVRVAVMVGVTASVVAVDSGGDWNSPEVASMSVCHSTTASKSEATAQGLSFSNILTSRRNS